MFMVLVQSPNNDLSLEYLLLNSLAMVLLLYFALKIARRSAFSWMISIFYLLGLVLSFIFGARITEIIICYGLNGFTVNTLFSRPYAFSLYGGLLFLILYQCSVAYLVGISPWDWLDRICPGIWSYTLIGKLGCFLNSCCFGVPTLMPWGVHYQIGSKAYIYYVSQFYLHASKRTYILPPYYTHPVQIYESIAALILLLFTMFLLRKNHTPGFTFLLTIGLYSLIRFGLHYLRVRPADAALYSVLPGLYVIVSFLSLIMLLKITHSRNT